MAGLVIGPVSWNASTDDDRHVEYKVVYKIRVADGEGPHAALNAVGLPAVGSAYSVLSDANPFAYCRPNARAVVLQEKEGETNPFWLVEITFSTKPLTRCGDEHFENPLLEPYRLQIRSLRYAEEATVDRFGNKIKNSAHEQIRGPLNEWDASRWSVEITFNTAFLNLPALTAAMDTVNSHPMWGAAARTIKLSGGSVGRRFYGTCLKYYEVSLELEFRREGWDRDLLDEGTKCLRGEWREVEQANGDTVLRWALLAVGRTAAGDAIMPNPQNPAHFIRAVDHTGNPQKIILDGAGKPFDPHLDPVTDCDQCPDGAARQWNLSGFSTSEDFAQLEGLQLEHFQGCTWTALNTVEIDGTTYAFELTREGGGLWLLNNGQGIEWSNDLSTDCLETVTLNRIQDDDDWPEEITIRNGTSEPGSIHVEKYPESNFFLLGIPAILE